MKHTNYLAEDVHHLMSPIPYLHLQDSRLDRFVSEMLRTALQFQDVLYQYPDVKYEPLALLYATRRALDALDEAMVSDLLYQYSWREASWGAWLACLSPHLHFNKLLFNAHEHLKEHTQVFGLALNAHGFEVHDDLLLLTPKVNQLRHILATMQIGHTPVRRNPDSRAIAAMALEAAAIKAQYREGGLEQARTLSNAGVTGYYAQSYQDWIASGALPAPDVGGDITPSD